MHKLNPSTTHAFAVGMIKNGPSGSGSFSHSSKDRLDILNLDSAKTFTKDLNVRLLFEPVTDLYFGCLQTYVSDNSPAANYPTLFSFKI